MIEPVCLGLCSRHVKCGALAGPSNNFCSKSAMAKSRPLIDIRGGSVKLILRLPYFDEVICSFRPFWVDSSVSDSFFKLKEDIIYPQLCPQLQLTADVSRNGSSFPGSR